MNTVNLLGRLTDDPDVRYTQGEHSTCIASYSLAVDRHFKDRDGNSMTDFFQCKSFGKTGEFVEKYLHKGSKIALSGRLEQERWTKDGKNYSKVVVIADRIEFAESKSGTKPEGREDKTDKDGFMEVPDEELPFV